MKQQYFASKYNILTAIIIYAIYGLLCIFEQNFI
jgi:hypothetical protein